jgi:hypothetical protein
MGLIDRVKAEWAVIKGAPYSFFIAVSICSGVLCSGCFFLLKNQIDSKTATIDQQDHQLSEYRQKEQLKSASANPSEPTQICALAQTSSTSAHKRDIGYRDKPNDKLIVSENQGIVTQGQSGGTNNVFNQTRPNRVISDTQAASISQELKSFSGTSIVVISPGNENEVIRYRDQILKILQDAGWRATGNTEIGGDHSGVPPGLYVGNNPNVPPPPEVRAIIEAFKKQAIAINLGNDTTLKEGDFNIVVGGNP